MSSAAIVSRRMRDSANATSSAMPGSRWWQTISMSRCSSTVLTVYGRVGLVDDGSTLRHAARLDDVGRVPAAGALGVIGVDRAPLERRQRVLDEARLVERVGVNRDLDVVAPRRRSGSSRSRRACVPQSSCSLRPRQPARICSSSASGGWRFPCRGSRGSSAARRPPAACARCSRRPACRWSRWSPRPARCRRRSSWSRRDISASSTCCGQMKWMCVSMPPAVSRSAFAGDDLGARRR